MLLHRTMAPCPARMQSAQREIALWFSPDELADYDVSNGKWIYE